VRYAALEIRLSGLGKQRGRYRVELKLDSPRDAAEKDPVEGVARLDPEKLLELHDRPGNEYGLALTKGLFADESVRTGYATFKAVVEGTDDFLRVKLRVAASAEPLHRLRWELLTDPKTGRPLATSEQILFSRSGSSTDLRPVDLKARGELRALVAVSNPCNLARYRLEEVDVDGEVERAREALKDIPVTVAGKDAPLTLDRLVDGLRCGCNVLYLVCHGGLNAKDRAILYLQNEEGEADVVAGEELAHRIGELRERPRLVVLASCESAGSEMVSTQDLVTAGQLVPLAPALANAGVHAVVAMQGKISMHTVKTAMPVFFEQLLQTGGQIDHAMAVARGRVREESDSWMPALFLRLKEGRLWQEERAEAVRRVHVGDVYPGRPRPDHPADASSLIGDHVRRFVDRKPELKRLVEFAAGETPGYLIVWAEGGLGKSSLLAELVDRRRRGDWPTAPPSLVYFFTGTGTRDTAVGVLQAVKFLQAVNGQLLGLLDVEGGTPSTIDELRPQFSQLWAEAAATASAENPLLLVVDGLDEMATGPADVLDVLPTFLPDYVHVVVSSRPNPDPRDAVAREHPLRRAEPLVLGPFDESSVLNALLRFGIDNAEAARLTPRVVDLTGGEPLFTRLVGRELEVGGEAALAALERDPPADVEHYFRDQLDSLERSADGYGDLSWDVVGILAVAPGRLARVELADILGERRRDVNRAVAAISRFLSGRESVELFHRRLRDEAVSLFRPAELDDYRRQVLAWCRDYQANSWPSETPAYILDNFASLLAEAGENDALLTLPDRVWLSRRRAASGSLVGFAADVAKAFTVSREREDPESLAAEIRLLLIEATLRSITTAAPIDAIAVLARAGRLAEASGYAELAGDALQRAAAYRVIAEARFIDAAPADAASLLVRGLALVAQADEADHRRAAAELRAYANLYGNHHMVDELEHAREVACSFAVYEATASALGGIGVAMLEAGAVDRAVMLADELLAVEDDDQHDLSVGAAAGIAAASGDADLVAHLVTHAEGTTLPKTLAEAAAAAATTGADGAADSLVERAMTRAAALRDPLSAYLDIARALAIARPVDARAAANRALGAATTARAPWLAYELAEIVPVLSAVSDVEGLTTAREAAVGLEDNGQVFAALAAAYARLSDVESARAALTLIPSGEGADQALSGVVRALLDAGLVEDAMSAVANCTASPSDRVDARAAAARHLYDAGLAERAIENAEQAIRESEHFKDAHLRSYALGSIAGVLANHGCLDDALIDAREALQALGTIAPDERTAAAVGSVAVSLVAVGLVEESLVLVAESEIASVDPELLTRLGVLLASSGNPVGARRVAELLLTHATAPYRELEMSAAAALVLATAGDHQAATEQLEVIPDSAVPGDRISILVRLAQGFAAVGQLERAEALAKSAGSDLLSNRESMQPGFASDAVAVAGALAAAGSRAAAAEFAGRAVDAYLLEAADSPTSIDSFSAAVPLLEAEAAAAAVARLEQAVYVSTGAESAFLLAALTAAYAHLDSGAESQRCAREAIYRAALAGRSVLLDIIARVAPTLGRGGPEMLLSLSRSLREVDSWWGD
jgi:hypothetical protein